VYAGGDAAVGDAVGEVEIHVPAVAGKEAKAVAAEVKFHFVVSGDGYMYAAFAVLEAEFAVAVFEYLCARVEFHEPDGGFGAGQGVCHAADVRALLHERGVQEGCGMAFGQNVSEAAAGRSEGYGAPGAGIVAGVEVHGPACGEGGEFRAETVFGEAEWELEVFDDGGHEGKNNRKRGF